MIILDREDMDRSFITDDSAKIKGLTDMCVLLIREAELTHEEVSNRRIGWPSYHYAAGKAPKIIAPLSPEWYKSDDVVDYLRLMIESFADQVGIDLENEPLHHVLDGYVFGGEGFSAVPENVGGRLRRVFKPILNRVVLMQKLSKRLWPDSDDNLKIWDPNDLECPPELTEILDKHGSDEEYMRRFPYDPDGIEKGLIIFPNGSVKYYPVLPEGCDVTKPPRTCDPDTRWELTEKEFYNLECC